MAGAIFVEELSDKLQAINPSIKEILRYMQADGNSDESVALAERCVEECMEVIKARVCFFEAKVEYASEKENALYIGGMKIESSDLTRNLSGCDRAIIFAATVGLELDRLATRYSVISPTKSLCIGAIGNERVETLCDIFYDGIKRKYKRVRPRFSPGYGDLPLSLQKDIFALLDCPKNIGVFLSDSMLMTPAKSVTAIVGVESGE